MTPFESIIKQSRECHTKQAWLILFETFGDTLATTSHSRPLQEIFRILKTDPQCLQYDVRIWNRLIQGCLSSWNLELGREIVDFVRKIPSPSISIPSSQIFLESGQPALARETANRTLRLTTLQPAERMQLEIIIASSYAEEGKRQKSIRQLEKVRTSVDQSTLPARERADFLMRMARMHFFLGRYQQAASLFYDSSRIYLDLKDWEAAAKAIFNTAACHLNAGSKRRDEAFALVEECRKLAVTHDLPGPLSHCEASYGVEAFQHGDFPAAREHLRLALNHLPESDKSYRRLHILSMLSYTYLAMGRYHLARKFGQQTLNLAALDESERNKTRYTALQAELLWEDGNVEESQNLLHKAISSFAADGIHTLEDLSTLNRLSFQSNLLRTPVANIKTNFDESIKNHNTWLTHVFTQGQQHLNLGNFTLADLCFLETLNKARICSDRYHEALGLLGQIQTLLKQRRADLIAPIAREFDVAVARLGDTPLKLHVLFIDAAKAYQTGNFDECIRILKSASRSTRQSFADRFALQVWIATIEGRSSRLTNPWQTHMVAYFTQTYFAPSVEVLDDRNFSVSHHYIVSLERHPSLADLLHYLLMKSNFEAESSEIQAKVWKQSLLTQGWQQKIRNTIMRLRDFFPQTMAPLILHSEKIALFKEAINLIPPRVEGYGNEEEILRLIADCPMSSSQVANRLAISPSTAKRILKKLSDEHSIQPIKQGRNVCYGPMTSGTI